MSFTARFLIEKKNVDYFFLLLQLLIAKFIKHTYYVRDFDLPFVLTECVLKIGKK